MNELALFAGNGGGILGGMLLGWRTVCAVEIKKWRRERLMQRQEEGYFHPFPIWDDINTFDGKPWAGCVDIVTGGFPCQDISCANPSGRGIDGERSGLWSEMARVVGEVGPRYVFVENSPSLMGRGIGRVLSDLSSLGYDSVWGIMGAHHAGAPHFRDRIWILGFTDTGFFENQRGSGKVVSETVKVAEEQEEGTAFGGDFKTHGDGMPADSSCIHWQARDLLEARANWESSVESGGLFGSCLVEVGQPASGWFERESGLPGLVDGMANRNDRLAASGDGQVPGVVALAWNVLCNSIAE